MSLTKDEGAGNRAVATTTPLSHHDETTNAALDEGIKYGVVTLGIMLGVLQVAMKKSPTFVARTNWQSRTAIVIMPPLFMGTLKSEQKVASKRREILTGTVRTNTLDDEDIKDQHNERSIVIRPPTAGHNVPVYQLYQNSDEHVSIVPGDKLRWYHHGANYIDSHPVEMLASMSVPVIGYIFYTNSSKAHLGLAQRLMHTRVAGQFATICSLLGVIGFSEYMRVHGRFMTQAESDAKQQEMNQTRLRFVHDHKEEQ